MLSPETRATLDTALKMAKAEGFNVFGYIHCDEPPEFATFSNSPLSRAAFADLTELCLQMLRNHSLDSQEESPEQPKIIYEA